MFSFFIFYFSNKTLVIKNADNFKQNSVNKRSVQV